MCVHLNKENSQGTMTLTDNKEERLRKNEGSSMHDVSCIGTKLRSLISQVFQVTSHIVGLFALHFVSSIQLLSLYLFIQFLTCTRILCRDSHCENGLVRCCLYNKSARPPFFCNEWRGSSALVKFPGPPSWKLAVS